MHSFLFAVSVIKVNKDVLTRWRLASTIRRTDPASPTLIFKNNCWTLGSLLSFPLLSSPSSPSKRIKGSEQEHGNVQLELTQGGIRHSVLHNCHFYFSVTQPRKNTCVTSCEVDFCRNKTYSDWKSSSEKDWEECYLLYIKTWVYFSAPFNLKTNEARYLCMYCPLLFIFDVDSPLLIYNSLATYLHMSTCVL